MTTFEKIKRVVEEVIGENIDVKYDTKFESIGLNSIMFIRVVVALEEKFDIEFEDEYLDYEMYNTVTDFCAYVERLLNE